MDRTEPQLAEGLSTTFHASCVRVGDKGVLIRGPSGSGKSHLAFALLLAARSGLIAPAMLVGDDRVRLERRGAALLAAPVPALAGLIEVRGAGIRRVVHVEEAEVGLVVDLGSPDGARLPNPEQRRTMIGGLELPRLAIYDRGDPLLQLIALLVTGDGVDEA